MAELNLDRILLGNAEGRNLLNTDKNFQQIQKEINLNKNEFQTFKDEIEENLNNAIIELDANVIKVTPTPVNGNTPTQYINSPVIINGDFKVTGTTTSVDTDTLKVKDNLIVANSTGASLTKPSGLAIATGTASGTSYPSAYGIVYDPSTETVKLGKGTLDSNYADFVFNQNEGKPIALRADSTTFMDENIIKWDSTNNIFVDGGIAYNEIGVINKDNTWSGINTFKSIPYATNGYGVHNGTDEFNNTFYKHGKIEIAGDNPRTLTLPEKSGTLATLDDIPASSGSDLLTSNNTWSGINTFSSFKALNGSYGFHLDALGLYSTPLTVTTFTDGAPNSMIGTKYGHGSIVYDPENLGTTYTLTIPKKSGTLATTSDLSGYGALTSDNTWSGANIFMSNGTTKIEGNKITQIYGTATYVLSPSAPAPFGTWELKLPAKSGTLATTDDIPSVDLSGYGALTSDNTWSGSNTFNGTSNFKNLNVESTDSTLSGVASIRAEILLGQHTLVAEQIKLFKKDVEIKLPNTSGTLATLSDIKPINSYFENCESVTAANDINIVPETNKRWVTINYNYGETEGELYWALKFSLDENVIDIFNEQKEKIATQMIFNTNTGEEGIFYIISPYVEGESSPMCYARFIGINTFN